MKIRYSQCWEDTQLMLSALDIQPADVVLSIASGGCNTFAIAQKQPQIIYAIDYNAAQIYLTQLKQIAINKLEKKELFEFLGITESKNRIRLFQQMEPLLTHEARQYFQENLKIIKKGIIHVGKFEKYIRLFRQFILPLIHSKKTIDRLMSITDKQKQLRFYHKQWNNKRWQLIFRVFFGKTLMKKRGRSKEMFQYTTEQDVGKQYFVRAENALTQKNVAQNAYLEYLLTGNYKKNIPDYLIGNLNNIKKYNKITCKTENIVIFLKQKGNNEINKYNLSDVFEAMSEEETEIAFHEILRTAKNNARLIFWNNLVKRTIPKEIAPFFYEEKEQMIELQKTDRIFFYEKFYIYTIKK